MTRRELFLKPLKETLESETFLPYAEDIVKNLPEYIFHVPAASSGKFHNKNELGDFGLCRHMIGTLKITDYLLSLDMYRNSFDSDERDLLRISALFHDGMKSGTQSDYEQNLQTKFNHPILMANFIAKINHPLVNESQTKFICDNIASHMGQWNTNARNPDIVLPTPSTLAQQLTHLSDYFASRTDITITFEPEYYPEPDMAGIKERLIDKCRDMLSNGVPRNDIIDAFVKHNGGKKNPNSVDSYAVAGVIFNTLTALETKYAG